MWRGHWGTVEGLSIKERKKYIYEKLRTEKGQITKVKNPQPQYRPSLHSSSDHCPVSDKKSSRQPGHQVTAGRVQEDAELDRTE